MEKRRRGGLRVKSVEHPVRTFISTRRSSKSPARSRRTTASSKHSIHGSTPSSTQTAPVPRREPWNAVDVQFQTAQIPALPATPRPDMTFFEARKERRWIDFVEYTSDITADRLISLSRVVKQATSNRALVSICYGYT